MERKQIRLVIAYVYKHKMKMKNNFVKVVVARKYNLQTSSRHKQTDE